MGRREFFKSALKKVKDTTAKVAVDLIKENTKRNFLRPPGAILEADFLLTCTRGASCKEACPYDAIHIFGVEGGIHAGTPFVDPQYSACQFCKDMPCVEACKPKALTMKNLKMGVAEFNRDHCLINQGQRCDYCFKSCPEGVAGISKGENGMPIVDTEECVGCGKCEYICVSQTGRAFLVRAIE